MIRVQRRRDDAFFADPTPTRQYRHIPFGGHAMAKQT
jgi:hypothetical protein